MEEEKTLKVTARMVNALIGAVAMFLFVIETICLSFAVTSPVFYGVMNIFVFLLSFCGFLWAYLRERKPSFEMWLNLAVFVFAMMAVWGLF